MLYCISKYIYLSLLADRLLRLLVESSAPRFREWFEDTFQGIFFVMELCSGPSLQCILEDVCRQEGRRQSYLPKLRRHFREVTKASFLNGNCMGFVHLFKTYTCNKRLSIYIRYDRCSKSTLKEVTYAISYLHGMDPPVIHRDLKPDNILLADATEHSTARLIDFGLASLKTDLEA